MATSQPSAQTIQLNNIQLYYEAYNMEQKRSVFVAHPSSVHTFQAKMLSIQKL
ncbi:hypothetical protein DER53_02095 [Parageobacillus toebii NBRC 107807]|jgi:hypothetical protein|uniref:Uncharacterized protein n=2 Tax=Anoxybacillaceae TaxID=3120669 RepID=A0A6G9J0V0_9BACL|nr:MULTISPECIES: hypothetical protein [Bacillaceae]QNU35427.1 hypothetical protein IC802_05805 [Geobacillus sp. 44C]MBB3869275.1 hypothetical protein [Parageobacillus toebii NBRC 107807]MED4968883.1 hypothetical protein [Parageobacillus toebii]MED4990868.1 hypothetical protein [Parageobacillus toebii]QIQ31802.1 hypothetical protein DER53_02095 [Parageobacillus toebii NBRC 107807]